MPNHSRDEIAMAVVRGLQNIDNLTTDVAVAIADDITDALPDDAPVMEWRVILVETTCKGEFWRGKPQQVTYQLVAESGGDYFSAASVWDREAAGADLPALRAAATAYSAAKGCRAVFTGEGAGDE